MGRQLACKIVRSQLQSVYLLGKVIAEITTSVDSRAASADMALDS